MGEKKEMPGISKLLKSLTDGDKKVKLIVALGIVGIALILLSGFFGQKSGDSTAVKAAKAETIEEYTQKLETKIHGLIENIEGVGNSRVLITMENGVEYVYADTEKNNVDDTVDYDGADMKKKSARKSSENTVVLVDGKDGKQALVVTELEPAVRGVVVVCEGGGQPLVVEQVTKAVTTVLKIGANRVCVTKLR